MFKREVPQDLILVISAVTYFVVTLVYLVVRKRNPQWIKEHILKHKQMVPILALTTLFGLFVANLLYLYCVKHAQNINIINVIMATYPVVTLLLASWLLKEHLNRQSFVGFVLVVIGIGIMVYSTHT